MAPQRLWGHEFDLLGSRDVIGRMLTNLREIEADQAKTAAHKQIAVFSYQNITMLT